MEELTIIVEEPSFLIISKPAGLFSQAAPGIESVETRLHELLQRREGASKNPFVGLPHRLDRGTSGVMIIARHQRALKRLGAQFQNRIVKKTYWAMVDGSIETANGSWEDWMRKIPDVPMAELVEPNHPEGRQAILHFQVVATFGQQSLLEIQLETGRMHQIRLQAASRGWPVHGDWRYGSKHLWGNTDPNGHEQELALHARRIEFRHPMNALSIDATADLPRLWLQRWPELASLCFK